MNDETPERDPFGPLETAHKAARLRCNRARSSEME